MQINKSDRDFLDYFGTTTHLFAIIVNYARQFRDLMSQPLLLRKFIEGKGLTSAQNDNFSELVYLLQNVTDEYRKRGTLRVAERANGNENITGELLRLINLIEPEEFLYALLGREKTGWCMGESSPTWTQTQGIKNLEKFYSPYGKIEDPSNYPIIGNGTVSVVNVDNEDVLRVIGYSNETGISYNEDQNYFIPVNPSIDYEVSFMVKVSGGGGENLSFGVSSFDANGNNIFLQSINDGSYTNLFTSTGTKNIKSDQWQWIRGVLHEKNADLLGENNLNFRNGKGLKMDGDVKYIVPKITVDGTIGVHTTYIKNITVRPLNLPFSQGILGVKNIILMYLKNNGQLSNDALETFTADKLIPYNSNLAIKYLN